MRRNSHKKVKIAPDNFKIAQKTTCFLGFMTNCRLQHPVRRSDTKHFLKSKKPKSETNEAKKAILGR